jgi:ABC-type Mn2+/Zn2+ transport systems, permease components
MLDYDFMRNAFAAAGVAAVVSGLVGYFLVLRGQTFAGHALSHIGFAGATGAVLIGAASVWGLVGFTVAAGIGMGMLGERLNERDVAIGVVLSLALGLGLLFLHYYTAFATQATALLFGNVLAVDRSMIGTLIVLGVITVLGLAAIMRPLILPPCSRNWPKPKACRCASSRRLFWSLWRSRCRKARKSSVCCWCSRSWSARRRPRGG